MSGISDRRPQMRLGNIVIAAAIIMQPFITGCKRVPSSIIQPEEMAQLLADIHTGESVAEQNYGEFCNDSTKRILKQSIYARHGVSEEIVDTSLMWYGHNLERYQKIYDRTIEILENRLAHINVASSGNALNVAGDSVDVWYSSRHLTLNNNKPTNFITFSICPDENWEHGDVYIWRLKTLNNNKPLPITITAEYADGVIETSSSNNTNNGWHVVQLATDSTKNMQRIYGVAHISLPETGQLYIDSISLVRKRLNQDTYNTRYKQKIYNRPNNQASILSNAVPQNNAAIALQKIDNAK